MKIIYIFIFLNYFFFNTNCVFSQTPGEWVWLHGDSITNNPGMFGIPGVPDPANYPPSLYEACEWTDHDGNFWLLGGLNGIGLIYGDLWKYNPLTNEWTWMNGSAIPFDPGNYGTQGVPSPLNHPPHRTFGANSWVDDDGNLWLFGGAKSAEAYSDLWKYDISTNEWTWMKGPSSTLQLGIYGTKGIPDPANNPGSRSETAVSLTDNAGDLWLFGGYSGVTNPLESFNDLWRFNISTNMWTWMKGSSVTDQPSVYGIKESEDSANTPGARVCYTNWKDLNGNFWIYGGDEDWNLGFNNRNDLWRFNPTTNNWAWMDGDTVGNIPTTNGILCTPDENNLPFSAMECRASWVDKNGNLWGYIFGLGIYNALWMYCLNTKEWAMIKADSSLFNAYPVWGTKGISSPATMPMGLQGPIGWSDSNNHLYMFGGMWGGGIWSNALWMYTIDSCCSACNTGISILDFSATETVLCPGTCTNLNNNSQSYNSFHWEFPGANPSSSNLNSPQNICYNSTGTYSMTLIGTGCNATDTIVYPDYITVFQQPSPQGIFQSGDTLFANAGAASYQWYFNGNIINGATNYFHVALSSGDYNIVASDTNECEVEAVINNVLAGLTPALSKGEGVTAFPNPATSTINIRGLENNLADQVKVFNVFGEKVFSDAHYQLLPTGIRINCQFFSSGLYYLEISSGEKIYRTKFIKQ
jgi:hypothetical protein